MAIRLITFCDENSIIKGNMMLSLKLHTIEQNQSLTTTLSKSLYCLKLFAVYIQA